ncbi:MAG: PQQ-binding-like beta-propeller repeat protein [Candidatus Bathyarchaeota archaeon]|nr:PQQ-binding-like beta-propeller repeat protein [Candidatus Bathyarchaeota archaeon]
MENKKNNKIALALVAILLFSSILAIQGFSTTSTVQAQTDYGDKMQYDWPMHLGNSENTNFNAGPAPNTPNVLWSTRRPDTGASISAAPPIAIDGKIIAYAGSTKLWAFDALTGALVWETDMNGGFRGFGTGAVYKIDDTYFGYEASDGQVVYRISDGQFIAKYTIDGAVDSIGALGGFPCMYWGGFFDSHNKMKYSIGQKYQTNEPLCIAFDLSNPTEPCVAWTWIAPTGLEHLGSGGGMAFFGGYGEGEIYALNATSGELVWRNFKVGNAGYAVAYSDGKVYHSASSTRVTCYNATNGDIIFDTDTGDRSFFAYGGAVAYGMYFDQSMLPGAGYIGAWDAETGIQRWKYPAHYTISYDILVVADGKVYGRACDQGNGAQVAGYPSPGPKFVCLDAFTGTLIWELPGINPSTPMIAYGNLYFVQSGTLYCIGDDADDWSQWQNSDTQGVGVGKYAPMDITTPAWVFEAGGPICGSPVAVDGKVYFGAYDGKYYCVDAKTSQELWTFETNYRVASTPAVVGGRLYTGADDGTIYCLNAADGTELWSTSAGRAGGTHIDPAYQIRSSPHVTGQTVYVGGMDGYLYALNTQNGDVRWSTQLTDDTLGIAGSPIVSNGVLYVVALDGWLSALDTSDGSQIWRIRTTEPVDRLHHVASTPIVVDGTVILGTTEGTFMGNMRIRGFSVADGSMLWEGALSRATGSTPMMWTPSYKAAITTVVPNQTNLNPVGTPYIVNASTTKTLDMLYLSEGMHVSAWAIIKEGTNLGTTANPFIVNTTGVVRIWEQWVGHQIFASVVVADTLGQPRGYVGNDAYGFTCFNLTDGSTLSTYVTKAQVFATAAINDGAVYVGSQDGCLYAFMDQPAACMEIRGWTNKGEEMFAGESLEIHGQLLAVSSFTPLHIESEPQILYSAIPNAEVQASFTNPDGSSTNYTATTDENGFFKVTLVPNDAGSCGWVVWYNGEEKPWITYEAANSEWYPVEVISQSGSETPEPTPTPIVTSTPETTPTTEPTATPESSSNIPMEYVYAIIAVVVIAILAVVAYIFLKKK